MSTLSPSEIVYLHPGRFAGRPTMGSGKHAPLDGSPAVACDALAEAAVVAALLGLERDGLVRLDREQKSTFFGLRKPFTVFAERAGGGEPVGAAEAGLLGAVGQGRAEVDEVVYRWLGDDVSSPDAAALEIVRDGLAARGFLERTETKKKTLLWTTTAIDYSVSDAARAALASADPEAVRAMTVDANGRPDLRETLGAEIRQGLARRAEQSAPDYDYGD